MPSRSNDSQALIRAYRDNSKALSGQSDFEVWREGSEIKAYESDDPISGDFKKSGFVRVEFWSNDDLWVLLPTLDAVFKRPIYPKTTKSFPSNDSGSTNTRVSGESFVGFDLKLQIYPLESNLTFRGSIGAGTVGGTTVVLYTDAQLGKYNSGHIPQGPVVRTPRDVFAGVWNQDKEHVPKLSSSNVASKLFFAPDDFRFVDASRTVNPLTESLPDRKLKYFGFIIQSIAANDFSNGPTKLKLRRDEQVSWAWHPAKEWVRGSVSDFVSSANVLFPERAGLALWVESYAHPFLRSLTIAKHGTPASFVPTFPDQSTGQQWQSWVKFRFSGAGPDAFQARVLGMQPLKPSAGPNVSAQFPHLYTTLNANLQASVTIGPSKIHLLSEDSTDVPRTAFNVASVKLSKAADGMNADTIRVGALDLSFADGTANLDVSADYLEDLNASQDKGPNIRVDGSVPLGHLAPGGQDDLPFAEYQQYDDDTVLTCDDKRIESGYRREPPLVLAASLPANPGALQLQILETNFPGTHSINLQVQTAQGLQNPNAAQLSDDQFAKNVVLIVDRTPFLVALVRYEPFESEAGAGALIANWNSGSGSVWQVRARRNPFELVLPPQGVGEQMVKGTEDPINSALDYRFSPPATEKLYSTYTPQHYVEAPWNLRTILGYVGQRDPGAEIVELQYELLYGLSCSVRAPLLRFADVASTMGRIPARLAIPPDKRAKNAITKEQSAILTQYDEYWSDINRVYNSRLAVYEPRRSGANYGRYLDASSEPPEILTLSEGVQCRLRGTADLFIEIPKSAPQQDDPFPIKADGLKGGVTYGFEAPRVFNATVRNLNSSSAQITAPFFSALGGWGMQKVGFDDDKTTIYADTTMGRTYSYSVTRIGRIGVYHNLAKHVIKYERAVLPSRAGFEHNPIVSWPVLRKVKEYIEILEERRKVGDQSENPSCAFVKRIHFKTKTIDVDSSWGFNVGESGWAIPLWKSDAGNYYSKPDITFELEDSNGVDVECGIDSPEKLVFYTDTRADQDRDPQKWPLVPKIDYPPLPPPQPCAGYLSGDIGETSPPEYDAPPGYAAFTLTLTEMGSGANVVAGRAKNTRIAATIRNVTIVRSGADFTASELDPALKSAQQALNGLRVDFRKLLASQTDTATLTGQLTQNVIPQAQTELNTAFANLADQANSLIKNASGQEKKKIDAFQSQFQQTLTTYANELHSRINLLRDNLLVDGKIDSGRLQLLIKQEESTLYQQLGTLQIPAGSLLSLADQSSQVLNRLSIALKSRLATFKADLNNFLTSALTSAIRQQLQLLTDETTTDLTKLSSDAKAEIARKIEFWMPQFSLLFDSCANRTINTLQQNLAGLRSDLLSKSPDDLKVELANIKFIAFQPIPWLDPQIPWPPQFQTWPKDFTDWPKTFSGQLKKTVADYVSQLNNYLCTGCSATEFATRLNGLEKNLVETSTQAATAMRGFLTANVSALTEPLLTRLQTLTPITLQNATQALSDLTNAVNQIGKTLAVGDVAKTLAIAQGAVSEAFESIASARQEVTSVAQQSTAAAARMLRALGKPPDVPNLGFSLPEIGYYYRPGLPQVDLTPVLGHLKDIGLPKANLNDLLSPISTSLPCVQLLDRLVPPDLSKFDLSDVLPDFAGLKLKGLLSNLKLPSGAQDHVRITHDVDKQRRRAWIRADINFDTTQPATLFSFGPLKLELPNANFLSSIEMSVESDGSARRAASGQIKGDWKLSAAGTEIVTLRKTALSFDERGNLKFALSPDNVQLSGALSFIADVAKGFSSESGFSFGILPTGFESRLDLPIPDIQAGTTGISGLVITSRFAVHLFGGDGFRLETGFALGRPSAPFNMTIFILGGGGYLDLNASYTPSTNALECAVKVAITVGASLAVALGPLQGGVYIYLGFNADFHFGGGAASGASLGILLVIRGNVSILGIVSAYVGLSLNVFYESGSLTGRGHFSISIKICWCFTLDVSSDIEYSIGSNQRTASSLASESAILLASLVDPTVVSDVPLGPMIPDRSIQNTVDYMEIAGRYINMFA